MRRGGEHGHVQADLGDDHDGGPHADARPDGGTQPRSSYQGGTRLYILSSGPSQRTLDAITPIVARPVPRSRACERSVGSPATVRDAS
jgi:hypothetical protein